MYKQISGNLGKEPPSKDPVDPILAATPMQADRDEDPYDKARQDALRLQWMKDGKYKIQGKTVTLDIPEFPVNQQGQSPSVTQFETGIASDPNILSNISNMGLFAGMTEKTHAANIEKLMNEGVGGAGMLWNKDTGFSSVSLSVNKRNLLGKEIVTKNLIGNVPDVFIYNDTVYNMQNPLSKKAFITDLETTSQKHANEVKKISSIREEKIEKFGYYGDDRETIEDSEYATGKTAFEKMKKERGFSADAQYYGSEGMGDAYQKTPEGVQTAAGLTAEEKQSALDAANAAARDNREQERQQAKEANYGDKTVEAIYKDDSPKMDAFNIGGAVDQNAPQTNLSQTGFIGGQTPDQVTDAQSVADNIPIQGDKGDYIINAPAIENDPETFYEMLNKGLAEAGSQGINITDIPSDITQEGVGNILASAGEFKIEKPLAEIIGYDQLDMFNNAGKGEVQQRLAASGGFINGYANGGDVDMPISRPDYDIVQLYGDIKNRFKDVDSARETTDKHIKKLSDEKLLALLAIIEGSKLGDKGMEAVMHVANNRANSNYKNFKNLKSIKDVLVQKTGKGAYEFSGFEIKGKAGEWDFRVQLSEMLSRAGGLKEGSLFFWNPDTSDISPVGLSKEEFNERVEAGEYLITENIEGSTGRHQHIRPSEIPDTEYPEESFLRSVDTKKRASEQLEKAKAKEMSRYTEKLEPLPEPQGLSKTTFLGNILEQRVKPQLGIGTN